MEVHKYKIRKGVMTVEKSNILLESGTNELEVVEFEVGGTKFGINVAKVREIINMTKAVEVPNSNPNIEGLFQLRGKVIPLINLAKYFGKSNNIEAKDNKIIVTEFNSAVFGFHVSSVSRIHRISWESIEAPSSLSGSHEGIITGVIKLEDQIILLLDFEKIMFDIAPATGMKLKDAKLTSEEKVQLRQRKRVMLVEDSEMLLQMIHDLLGESGYSNQAHMKNGKEAWDCLEQGLENPDLIITDIEMPRMDGHHLTKLIKTNSKFKHIPVIIFSSLINDQMYAKGRSLGANEQVTKPEIDKLINLIDKYIL